jgi:hypothetical protein
LIIGSILIWNGDVGCPGMKPQPVKTMIWAAVISSFIAIFLRLIQKKAPAE